MPKKNRLLDPRLDTVIQSLRVAGMPERNTYETLRDVLLFPPSYRTIRAAYARGGLVTKRDASSRRGMARKDRYIGDYNLRKSRNAASGFPALPGEHLVAYSNYRRESEANRRNAANAETAADLQTMTDRHFALGYLNRSYGLREGSGQGYADLQAILDPADKDFTEDVKTVYETLKT